MKVSCRWRATPKPLLRPVWKSRAVEIVGAAARDHDGARGAGELGARYGGLHAELLYGVESGRPGLDRAGVAVLQVDAVLDQVHRGVAQAVDLRLAGAAFQTGDGDGSRVWMLRPFSGSCSIRARSTMVATVGLVVESSGVTSPATVICSADFATVRVASITARWPAARMRCPASAACRARLLPGDTRRSAAREDVEAG